MGQSDPLLTVTSVSFAVITYRRVAHCVHPIAMVEPSIARPCVKSFVSNIRLAGGHFELQTIFGRRDRTHHVSVDRTIRVERLIEV